MLIELTFQVARHLIYSRNVGNVTKPLERQMGSLHTPANVWCGQW